MADGDRRHRQCRRGDTGLGDDWYGAPFYSGQGLPDGP